ncbi:MAG: DUF2127 domain-containing protein [Patescibacteria group bacterium]|nr:DUF2127 domain-containing protein [Patescibacteria group bacterium]
MLALISEKTIRRLFDLSVVLKGLHAILELVSGAAILMVSPAFVMNVATALTADELTEDPHDFLANRLMHYAAQFSTTFQHIAALYLISHGIVITFLVIGLLRKWLWSYPVSMIILGLFIVYQSYQFVLDHSWWVLGVTVLDIIVILLTLHEYRYLKQIRSNGYNHAE